MNRYLLLSLPIANVKKLPSTFSGFTSMEMVNLFLPSKNPVGREANVPLVPSRYNTLLPFSSFTVAFPFSVPSLLCPLTSLIVVPSVFSKS